MPCIPPFYSRLTTLKISISHARSPINAQECSPGGSLHVLPRDSLFLVSARGATNALRADPHLFTLIDMISSDASLKHAAPQPHKMYTTGELRTSNPKGLTPLPAPRLIA
jgi:hypothetical protein